MPTSDTTKVHYRDAESTVTTDGIYFTTYGCVAADHSGRAV
jgi:hypothetical protein